jgi:anti-sigma regulatory factor (Ser/Thr protein kinase)
MARFTQKFSSDLRQLVAMRAFVRDACQCAGGLGPDEEAMIAQLELALSEAAANIILHANQGEAGRPIELIVDTEADRISLSIYHQGRDFDPEAVPPPTFDGRCESGFGLYIMKQTTDEVTYLREESGRRGVRLVKKRP